MSFDKKEMALLAIASWAVGLNMGYMILTHYGEPNRTAPTDTVRVTKTDTVRITVMEPSDSVILRYERVALPADTSGGHDTTSSVPADSAAVMLPITQRMYSDSLYQAWISGYEPRLDSLHILRQTYMETVTRSNGIPVRKRWGVGIQAGYGITLDRNPRIMPYVGVGVSWNLWNF